MTRESQQPSARTLATRLSELEAELDSLRRALARVPAGGRKLPTHDLDILRCSIGGDAYGIRVESVKEILRYVQVTRVADVPAVVAGVINVRGEVVPVIDARSRFGHAATAPRRGTAIVLTRTGDRELGLIVDQVVDLATAARSTLRAPEGPLGRAHGVAAIATLDSGVTQVVDLEQVLSGADWANVAHAIRAHASSAPPADHGRGSNGA